jgi:hypothetical protein
MGLLLGSQTLVAEWYFLPMISGFALVMGYCLYRDRVIKGRYSTDRIAIALFPVVTALFMGSFNNTYLAGAFGHFWMRYPGATETMSTRLLSARIQNETQGAVEAGSTMESLGHSGYPRRADLVLTGKESRSEETAVQTVLARKFLNNSILGEEETSVPTWNIPNLVPLRLNVAHFGKVPSWESAASNDGTFVSIFGASFLMEAFPVLLLGIPFGLWLAWRRPTPIVLLLAWLAFVSALPPIFLDWGYRSTDFLRFFTASFSFAALFFGWLVGDMLVGAASIRTRLFSMALVACALISAVGLGVIGLMPGTLTVVESITSTAGSLSQVQRDSLSKSTTASDEIIRSRAFEVLAVKTGDYLFPLTQGRDRAIVIVPSDQVPETKYFPEWMKMATLSRIELPVGWHWSSSPYSAYYREAVTQLDPSAITALGAKWLIVSNVFQDHLPTKVAEGISDPKRFLPVAQFRDGKYSMAIFSIR